MKTLTIFLALSTLAPAAIITTTFDNGGGDNLWSTAANWNPDGTPNNNATDQFDVTLPASLASPVVFNVSASVNSLSVGASTTLSTNNGLSLTLAGDCTNNGTIQFNGTSTGGRLLIDHPSDAPVTLSGSGVLRFTGGGPNVNGAIDQLLINGPNHTIEGSVPLGTVGSNNLNIQNEGTIVANVSGETFRIDPRSTFENTGSVAATNGGILKFESGSFTGDGTYQVSDNSELQLQSATLENLTISADNLDVDPGNNIVRATLGSNLTNVTLEAGLTVTTNNGQPITLLGDVTNDAVIEFNGTSTNTRLLVDHPSDAPITLGGSGTLRFIGVGPNVNGAIDQLFINGPNHTIEGSTPTPSTTVGGNSLNIQNAGTLVAGVSGEALRIDPRFTFENTGSVAATNGGILSFQDGTFSGSGSYQVGDNCELQLQSASLENLTISADDLDANPDNNIVRAVLGPNLADVTLEAGLTVTTNNGQPITLLGDVTNDAVIEFDGTSSGTRLLVNHPSGAPITLGGSGTLRFTGGGQNANGALDQLLINGPDHTIEGFTPSATVGSANLNIRNEGTIVANVSGEALRIYARTSVENIGTLWADNGGTLEFFPLTTFENSGTLRAAGGSTILLGDNDFVGTGLLEVTAGSTIEMWDPSFTQTGGEFRVDGSLGVREGDIVGGKVSGNGTIFLTATVSSLILNGGILAPGSAANPIGNLTFFANSFNDTVGIGNCSIEIDLESQTVHDSISFPNAIAEDAFSTNELRLSLKGPASGFTGARITILRDTLGFAEVGGSLITSGGFRGFTNVDFGDRLTTTDGLASFEVEGSVTQIENTTFTHGSDVHLINPLFAPEWAAAPYAFTIPAGSALGAAVGTVSATDPETDPVTYSIGPFAIDSSSGAITVADAGAVASDTAYNIAVTASDGDLSNTTIVAITVGNPTTNNATRVRDLLTEAGGAFPGETDPAIIGFDADPDHDGIGNAFELWLGLDPSAADDLSEIVVFPTGAAPNTTATLDVRVDQAVDDLLQVEGTFSFDLTGAYRTGTRSVLSEDGAVRVLRYLDSLPSAGRRGFGRLEADPNVVKP